MMTRRLTHERETRMRALMHADFSMPPEGQEEVFAELDAVRADLAELVGALPRCCRRGCGRVATRQNGSIGADSKNWLGHLWCDECSDSWQDKHEEQGGVRIFEMPTTTILRRLEGK